MDILKKHVTPRKHVAYRNIADEAVIVHTLTDKVVTLNSTGTFIWNALPENNVKKIIELVSENFDVKFQVASNDTLEFVNMLLDRDFVEVKK